MWRCAAGFSENDPPKFTKALFLLCLAAELFLLVYPGISNKVVSFLIQKESEDYDQYTYMDTDFYFDEAAACNQALAASGSRLDDTKDVEAASGYLNPLGTGIIDYIKIKKIDVYLPIYNNTGEESLQSGAGSPITKNPQFTSIISSARRMSEMRPIPRSSPGS